MKKTNSILIVAALLATFTFYSCTNCRNELTQLESKCDSLQQVIDDMTANCIDISKLPKGNAVCRFEALTTENATDAVNNVNNFNAFTRSKGYDTKNNAKGYFISNDNILEILRDVISTNAVGVYVHIGTDNSSTPHYFRYYYTAVSCTKNESSNFEFTPISEYKYSDVGCPMHCAKY